MAQEQATLHRLVFLDGRQMTAAVQGVKPDGTVTLSGQPAVKLNDLREISPIKSPAKAETGPIRIGLLADGVLRVNGITLKDENFLVDGGFASGKKLPLESVRSILFAAPADAAFAKAVASPSEDADRLIVKLRGKLRTVSALTESLDSDKAVVSLDNRNTTIPRTDIHGIVFAYIKKPLDRNGLCRVELADGSIIPSRITGLSAGKLNLKLVGGTEMAVPWSSVVQVAITSDRLQFVSELQPSEVIEQTIVAFPRKWQKDRNVTGGVLSIAKSSFKKGIGVHARSRIAFVIDGRYETFAATIGLDDAAGGKGDCLFVVLGDGREIIRKRMRGSDKPHSMKADVKGIKKLVLLVEPGENLDIADHANWCNAILIRPPK